MSLMVKSFYTVGFVKLLDCIALGFLRIAHCVSNNIVLSRYAQRLGVLKEDA